jgi:hypothetical protein
MQETGSFLDLATTTTKVLADLLEKFYTVVVPKFVAKSMRTPAKSTGSEPMYHKNTLINIRAAINRKLADLNRTDINIVGDKAFKHANGVLNGLLKKRMRTGMSKATQHKPIIEIEDLKKIATYLTHARSSPITLRQAVWYNISIHFVTRGLEMHHQLRLDAFEFHVDESGEYVTLNCEIQQKNWQGGLGTNDAPSGKRMYSTGTENCPVNMLQLLIEKTDKNATSLFNQYNREAVFSPSTTAVWFADKALSKRSFGNFLGDICKAAKVQNHYTPHCLRATAIQCLSDEGFEARQIMYMSDHKCESSLRSYNKCLVSAETVVEFDFVGNNARRTSFATPTPTATRSF